MEFAGSTMMEGEIRVEASQAHERRSRQQRKPQHGASVLGEPGRCAVREKPAYPVKELWGQADADTKCRIEPRQQAGQVANNGGGGERVRVAV
jgi:hypothetical protein